MSNRNRENEYIKDSLCAFAGSKPKKDVQISLSPFKRVKPPKNKNG